MQNEATFHLFVCLRMSHVMSDCKLLQTLNDWSLVSSSSETLYHQMEAMLDWPTVIPRGITFVFTWELLDMQCLTPHTLFTHFSDPAYKHWFYRWIKWANLIYWTSFNGPRCVCWLDWASKFRKIHLRTSTYLLPNYCILHICLAVCSEDCRMLALTVQLYCTLALSTEML